MAGTANSSAELDSVLQQVRSANLAGANLWQTLLDKLQLAEDALARLLHERLGIHSIDLLQWQTVLNASHGVQLTHGATGLASIATVTLGSSTLLLCADPWSEAAQRAKAWHRVRNIQLAIARPGQLEALDLRSNGAPDSTPMTTLVRAELAPSGAMQSAVQFVDLAIARAYADGASDIHVETDRQGIQTKFRLDGVMTMGQRLDNLERAEEVISRIKVLAQLDITERRRPQDGRIHWRGAGTESIDLRVSIMPSIFGEDAVLRLLDKAQLRHSRASISLDALGFEAPVAEVLRGLASRPHGMLLVTGPTGSGKTTTVYAALSEVNDGLEKIVTIEDPVEYELPGVLQIPVNEQKGLTFATGLRSILRHDPDKILVGEIRDSETAEIAIQSALTGHLVFTTVHANSLFDVLGRFQHFGIDPFALASALNGVVVQRLLRRLCPHCLTWRELTTVEQSMLSRKHLTLPHKIPVANGCEHCRQTGYRGRFVVAEIHVLDDAIRDLIVGRATMSQLKAALYQSEAVRLLQQAMMQVGQGASTLEEVTRVIGLD